MEAVISGVAEAIFPPYTVDERKELEPVWEAAGRQAVIVVERDLSGSTQQQVKLLLWLLSRPWSTSLLVGVQALCGQWPFVRSFAALPLAQRQQALRNWQRSALPPIKKVYMAIKGLAASSLLAAVDEATQTNRALVAAGYAAGPVAAVSYNPPPAADAAAAEEVLASGVLHLPQLLAAAPTPTLLQALLTRRGLQVVSVAAAPEAEAGAGAGFFQQLQSWWSSKSSSSSCSSSSSSHPAGSGAAKAAFKSAAAEECSKLSHSNGAATAATAAGAGGDNSSSSSSGQQLEVELSADVVVVGSGAGGGVVAALLAAAGLRVVVLEKSTWMRMEDMTWQEAEAMANMYECGGLVPNREGTVTVLAGSTLGGGTKVNWCASLPAPPHVRQEWAEQHGLTAFTSGAFQRAVDAVCKRLSVNQDTRPNGPNAVLAEGLTALKAEACRYPRNCTSQECSGYCTFGCKSGHKQSSDMTWLVDAVKAGALVLTGVTAQRVMKEACAKGSPHPFKATGISATVTAAGDSPTTCQLIIRAPRVFSCAGAMHTPALLLRSGISCQGNVGRHLRLHPASGVLSTFDHEAMQQLGRKDVDCYRGVMMQTYSLSAAHYQEGGYGAMVSVPAAHPALLGAMACWHSNTMLRKCLNQLPRQMAAAVVFTRDSSGGVVQVDGAGRMVYDYWPCAETRKHMLEGLELAARAHAAAGASRVLIPHASETALNVELPPLSQPVERAAAVEAFVATLWRVGVERWALPVFSAHQMGSCRMGTDPRKSAVDAAGQCWEVSGLYVADASAFPTATGVNPMITVQAIAHMLAQGVVAQHKKGS